MQDHGFVCPGDSRYKHSEIIDKINSGEEIEDRDMIDLARYFEGFLKITSKENKEFWSIITEADKRCPGYHTVERVNITCCFAKLMTTLGFTVEALTKEVRAAPAVTAPAIAMDSASPAAASSCTVTSRKKRRKKGKNKSLNVDIVKADDISAEPGAKTDLGSPIAAIALDESCLAIKPSTLDKVVVGPFTEKLVKSRKSSIDLSSSDSSDSDEDPKSIKVTSTLESRMRASIDQTKKYPGLSFLLNGR